MIASVAGQLGSGDAAVATIALVVWCLYLMIPPDE